jgi:hypothetical protein
VEKESQQAVGLVLALDISAPVQSLAQLQEALKAFVATLEPEDKVAIVTFENQAQVVQDFTAGKAELQAAIAALQAKGNYTALNEAIVLAATTAGSLPPGRRAVVVLTDSDNNTGGLSTADAVKQARETGIPFTIIGLQPKVKENTLTDLAGLAGRRPIVLSLPGEVGDRLKTVVELLRPAYRVTFQSALSADNAEHDLTLSATYEGQARQAQAKFVAVPGEVTVKLPGLVDGQTVAGAVDIAVEIAAPAPVASVEYRLGEQVLGEQNAPPFTLAWDSAAVEAGAYTLVVKAVDAAGNTGQAEVRLNVAAPIVVSVATSHKEVELGNPVTVEAQVDALTEVTEVDFYVDGKLLGRVDAPVYHLSFDSSAYPTGTHTIIVRAKDSLGRGEEAGIEVQFVAPKRGWPTFAVAAVMSIAVMVAVIIAGVIFAAIQARLRRRYQKRCRLEIQNLGNARSRYRLLAEDRSGDLRFQFTLDGVNLQQGQAAQAPERAMEAPRRPGREAATPAKRVERPAPPREAGSLDKVRQAGSKAKGIGATVADALSAVAAILPSSIGAPLRNWSRQLRQQQAAITYAERAPQQMASQIRRIPGVPDRAAKSGPAATPSPAAPPPVEAVAGPQYAPVVPISRAAVVDQTPFVEPGETLTLGLLVEPIKRPHQNQHYTITVTSKPLEQEDAPPQVEEGTILIPGVSWLRHYAPLWLPVIAAVVVEFLLLSLLLRFLGIRIK